MIRAVTLLCAAAALLFMASVVTGFFVEDLRFYKSHFLPAMATLLLALLIHVSVMTYVSATGRMIQQAAGTAGVPSLVTMQIRRDKVAGFRVTALAVASLVVLGALGALASGDPRWREGHFVSVLFALVANAVAVTLELGILRRQAERLTRALEACTVARAQRLSAVSAQADPVRKPLTKD